VTCVRRAWLVLNGQRLDLEDDLAGYACTNLDLGYPEVRDVVSPRADASGSIDRTALMGSRAVAVELRAYGGTMTVDEIAAMWARYMLPVNRPELHYVLDRPDAPERMCVVRASGYAWPISGKRTRDIQLSWIAPDPTMVDPVQASVSALAGSSTSPGRLYPFTHNRIYPPGGGSPTTGVISSPGDVDTRPLLRVYGPITTPAVHLQIHDPYPNVVDTAAIVFVAGFRVDAGKWVDVDTNLKTATRDDGSSVVAGIDWQASVWPVIPPAPADAYMTLTGDTTSAVTQVVAYWHDGYLT